MTKESIFEKVQSILADELDIDKEEVLPSSDLIDDIGLGSVEVMSLVATIEKAFSIKIPEKLLRTFVTVQDILGCIEANRKGTAE